jgi:predicted flap endonuclease-1-like 5' DNA nuclease
LSAKEAEIRVIVAQRDARIAELESVRTELGARDLKIKELETALLARETKVTELERELEGARARSGDPVDDLKLIKGIGPAFERELKRLGVHTFAQIAAWTPADIDEIAPKIKARVERIKRDDWVKRAADFAAARGK